MRAFRSDLTTLTGQVIEIDNRLERQAPVTFSQPARPMYRAWKSGNARNGRDLWLQTQPKR